MPSRSESGWCGTRDPSDREVSGAGTRGVRDQSLGAKRRRGRVVFKEQRKAGGLQGLSRRQAWELLTPSSVTPTWPFDLGLRYLSPTLLCWLLDTGIYNQLVMLCTLDTLQVFMGLKRRSSLLQSSCWETWGRARGLRGLLVWLGSLRFPGNGTVMAGEEAAMVPRAELKLLPMQCTHTHTHSHTLTHTHTHSHTHTLTPATLGFTFPSPPPLSYTQR